MAAFTPDEWRLVAQLFDAAADLPPDARSAFLDPRCPDPAIRAEVDRMLHADLHAAAFLDDPPLSLPEPSFSPQPGLAVGPYRLLRSLGQGGMGSVWLAERADGTFSQQVAIKFSLSGLLSAEARRRLHSERRILAQLQHPHIARLLDAGAAGPGVPYFVMEYVDGQPLLEYARSRRLSVPHRLLLFYDLCLAVHYAHQRLIVHRDLKPANILIDANGRARLLDFGVAKLLQPDDGAGSSPATVAAFWTPAYASPEQLRGLPVTTAADIYSLGLVLHQLLTGASPSPGVQPPPPSRFDPALDRDLDSILCAALEPEPERRYASARDFADDIHAVLQRRPVSARPQTLPYRFAKFLNRNRALSAVLSVAILSTFAALALFGWQWRAARRAEALAQSHLQDVHRLATSLLFDYHDQLSRLPGSTALRARIAASGLHYLQSLSSQFQPDNFPPSLNREISSAWLRLGDVQGRPWLANRGDHNAALASYRQAEAWARRPPPSPRSIALALQRQGQLEIRLHQWPNALSHLRQAAGILRPDASPAGRQALASALSALADARIRSGDPAGIALHRQALQLIRTRPASPDATRLAAIVEQRMGNFLASHGSPAEALQHHLSALRAFQSLSDAAPSDPALLRDFADQLVMMAEATARAGLRAEALAGADRGIALLQRLALQDPSNLEARRDFAYAWFARAAAAGCDPHALRQAIAAFQAILLSPAASPEDRDSLSHLQGRARTCR